MSSNTTKQAEMTQEDEQKLEQDQPQFNNVPLEQLTNTNVMTIRLKWKQDDEEQVAQRRSVEKNIRKHILENFGHEVELRSIEPFQYLKDEARLQILEEKKDIYKFENGNEEFSQNYNNDEDKDGDWKYDLVQQFQFHNEAKLEKCRDSIDTFLHSKEDPSFPNCIEKWSISINKHALTHPGNIFIGGINHKIDESKIRALFEKFGSILSIKLFHDRLMNSNTNNSTSSNPIGYGFISFVLGSQASFRVYK